MQKSRLKKNWNGFFVPVLQKRFTLFFNSKIIDADISSLSTMKSEITFTNAWIFQKQPSPAFLCDQDEQYQLMHLLFAACFFQTKKRFHTP